MCLAGFNLLYQPCFKQSNGSYNCLLKDSEINRALKSSFVDSASLATYQDAMQQQQYVDIVSEARHQKFASSYALGR